MKVYKANDPRVPKHPSYMTIPFSNSPILAIYIHASRIFTKDGEALVAILDTDDYRQEFEAISHVVTCLLGQLWDRKLADYEVEPYEGQ